MQVDIGPESIEAAAVPLVAKIGGGVVAAGGLVAALTGLQTVLAVTIYGPLEYAPYALMTVGAAMIVTGVLVFRARFGGAVAATVASAIGFVSTIAWGAISFTHHLYSLYAFVAPFFSLVAIVVAAISIGPCKKATEARERLTAQGLDLGL